MQTRMKYSLVRILPEYTEELHNCLRKTWIDPAAYRKDKLSYDGRAKKFTGEQMVQLFGSGIMVEFNELDDDTLLYMDRVLALIMYIGLASSYQCQKKQTPKEVMTKGLRKFRKVTECRRLQPNRPVVASQEMLYPELKLLRCINLLNDKIPQEMMEVWIEVLGRFDMRIDLGRDDGKLWIV